jgi:hypothetical protein
LVLLLVSFAPGCTREPARPAAAPAESEVREKFAQVQAAVKAGDADRIWALMSSKSRADAEKEAKAMRTAYQKGTAGEKAALEKDEGLGAEELAKLTGLGFLKTERFRHKHHDLPGGTITRVSTAADTATVYFVDEDNEDEKLHFVREEGQWKAWLAMPKKAKPRR